MPDTQNFFGAGQFAPKRSTPDEVPLEPLLDFYASLKAGDDDQIQANLLRLGKLAGVKTPSWNQFIQARPHFGFHVDCFDERGKWKESREAENLVTREGLGYLIGCGFQVTSPPTKKTNFFVTQSKATFAAVTTDTATTHTFTEIVYVTDVSQTVRPTLTFAATSTGADLTECDNGASQAVFNQLTSITLYGLAVISLNAAGTSSGYTGDIYYGATLYGTSLVVLNGYQVNVQATISATAG